MPFEGTRVVAESANGVVAGFCVIGYPAATPANGRRGSSPITGLPPVPRTRTRTSAVGGRSKSE